MNIRLTLVVLTGFAVQPLQAQVDPDFASEASPAPRYQDDESGEEPAGQNGEKASDDIFAGLAFRSIGPAITGGRIGDFAVDPGNRSRFYAAVASGGVWKTENAGTTWTPVFDQQGSYSIGCIELDPHNPNVVWVGTGENNSQRSVGFGDGVYRSRDGGKSWENLGLKDSEHIGMIAIDPRDSDVVYVAAQGPLWRSGPERGLYKTTDGGRSWFPVLQISPDTGVNEVHFDPRDPDTLYASAYQRRRHTWTLIDGGPESAIYKSTDAGRTWRKINKGLPGVDLGRIGLAIAPADPDVLYAIVEAADGKSGVFRSTDRGETWEKRSGYIASSPQYYNELVPHPTDPDCVYSLDTFLHVTRDGGKSFQRVPRLNRHVDDHALWIDPDDTDYMLVGCDGGVYISHDGAENWRFIPNLPITQFYRVTVDNSTPFYYVYGGTQDNNTFGGPSRTTDTVGISNDAWFVTVGGDGFEPQVDPTDPNIVYSQWQNGGLVRYDRRSGEVVDIRPREEPGEEGLRWNWDSPLLISPHDPARLYYGANRLYRSDDRGSSWRAISPDLTRQIDRNTLKVFGRIQSVDAVAKGDSTSFFGNTVALSESPRVEGLIYVGTDDGLIQVTENGGEDWRRIERFPGVPDMSYVSCVIASRHDADRVFATFDNHKQGDFQPYVLRSDDRGQTWTSVAGNLGKRETAYALREDAVNPQLLFVGTEFGVYFTTNGGEKWTQLKGGIPTIAVRDLEVQDREGDLVLATFGRGFYILDDYTPLRMAGADTLESPAVVFPVKPALGYVQWSRLGGEGGKGWQGADYYAAPNPPFGATFTYYLKEKLQTRKEKRQEAEKKAEKDGKTPPYPTTEETRAEEEELAPQIVLVVKDAEGRTIRRIPGPRDKGVHRVTWDLRFPAYTPIQLGDPGERAPWDDEPSGPMAMPGKYSVTLVRQVDGVVEALTEPQPFEVVPLERATFATKDPAEALAFKQKVGRLQRAVQGALRAAGEAENRLAFVRKAIVQTPDVDPALLARADQIQKRLDELLTKLRGDRIRGKRNEPDPPSISERVNSIVYNAWYTTSAPTETQRDGYEHGGAAFAEALAALRELIKTDLAGLEQALEEAGAPWTPGRLPDWKME